MLTDCLIGACHSLPYIAYIAHVVTDVMCRLGDARRAKHKQYTYVLFV